MSAETSAPQRGSPFTPGNRFAFPKGVSGCPGGRPKQGREVVELARELSPDAIRALHEIAVSERTHRLVIVATLPGSDIAFRLGCSPPSTYLLDASPVLSP